MTRGSDRTPIPYTQTGCVESGRVRDWLIRDDFAFVERNVTGDLDAARDLLSTGSFGTPLLDIGRVIVVGFRPHQLSAALERTPPR